YHNRDRRQRNPPPPAARVCRGENAGDAEQRRDRDERAQVIDVVERRVELLNQQDRSDREPNRQAESDREEASTARCGRLAGWNGRVENPELLHLLSLLEA